MGSLPYRLSWVRSNFVFTGIEKRNIQNLQGYSRIIRVIKLCVCACVCVCVRVCVCVCGGKPFMSLDLAL